MGTAAIALSLALAACGGAVSTAVCDADAAASCASPSSSAGPDASPGAGPDAQGAGTDAGTDGRAVADAGVDAPPGLGASTPCLGGGSVLYFDGPSFSSTTSLAVRDRVTAQGDPENVYVGASNGSGVSAAYYNAAFSTVHLAEPMTTQLYANAQRTPFEENGHPGLDVSGDGRGCNTIEGSFRVDTLTWDADGGLAAFTAAFEQFCDGESTPIRGCVHFER
jgi:hypothetical protein